MSRYLEFTTTPSNETMHYSEGNAVFDGALPPPFTSAKGIRVDGEILELEATTLADDLHRTLRGVSKLRRHRLSDNSVAFAARMHGVPPLDPAYTSFFERTDQAVKDGETWPDMPVILGIDKPERLTPEPRLMVVPVAHELEDSLVASYVYPLPHRPHIICLSGLRQAMELTMVQCDSAHLTQLREPTI